MDVRLPLIGPGSPNPEDEPQVDFLLLAIHQADTLRVRQIIAEAPARLHQHIALDVPESNPPRQESWLPIHHAAVLGDVAIVALLLDAGAHPDARTRASTPDYARATALHLAAAMGHVSIIELLIQAKAEVNVLDASQQTPLRYAAEHPKVEQRLLAAGADPSVGREVN